jgi:hypothetical protein
MNACNVLQPQGINLDCLLAEKEIKNVWITDKDLSFTWATKDVQANWDNAAKQDLTLYGAAGLINYTPTTDDPNIVTEPVSKTKTVTNTPVPSFEFFLKSNFCDFKQLLNTLKGGTYGVFYEKQDGTILGKLDQSGSEIGYFKPFRAKITALTKGAPEIDSVESFKVFVNHLSYDEFLNGFLLETIDTDQVIESMPIGVNMVKTVAYASGDQAVKITIRCAANLTGLLVADFEGDETQGNVDTPAVTTVVDNGAGTYDLTVQKDAVPANLVDGDKAVIRVNKLSGSDTTHISNYITVEGVT